jgi:erythromycin esterase
VKPEPIVQRQLDAYNAKDVAAIVCAAVRGAALLYLIVLLPRVIHAQQSSEAFEKWASARAIPLRTVEADGDMKDLLPLKSVVGGARVVAIGEPNHGTHEPLALRNRLIRFLVEQMGFTAVALETGFTESFALERFVAGSPGELHNTVRDNFSWGFGNFPENEELIQWIRGYNADTNHLGKLRFYGIDLSGAKDGAFPQARRAVDFAITFLARGDSAAVQSIREKLEPCLKKFSTWNYASMSSAEREQLVAGFTEITATLERKRSSLVSLSSDEEYEWALHSVVVARQLNTMFEVSPTSPWTGPGIPPDAYRMTAARDSGMADNVCWALDREKPNGRLVVFAHNGHVMNSSMTGGIWSVYPQPPSVMGKFLRPVLGGDLVIIGGSSGAAPGGTSLKDDPNNIDSAFAHLGISRFILDLRSAREDKAAFAWLSTPRSLHSNIETFVTVTPSEAFDALYFVDNLTGTRARKP